MGLENYLSISSRLYLNQWSGTMKALAKPWLFKLKPPRIASCLVPGQGSRRLPHGQMERRGQVTAWSAICLSHTTPFPGDVVGLVGWQRYCESVFRARTVLCCDRFLLGG